MDGFIVSGQYDGGQQAAPDLTSLHQSAEQSVESGDRSRSGGRLAVAEGQSGKVGRLSTPQRAGESPGHQGPGYQKRAGLVEVGGDVGEVNGVRGDDRPLDGQSSDDVRRVEAGDRRGRVQCRQGRDAECSTMVQRTLKRLDRRKRRQPTHNRSAEYQQVLERLRVLRTRQPTAAHFRQTVGAVALQVRGTGCCAQVAGRQGP